jgi:putative sporulation protein YtaF
MKGHAMNIYILQDILLVLAVSTDALIAAFSFGSGKIRIPPLSALIISIICTAILTGSILLSTIIGGFIPEKLCRAVGAAILTIMGTVSLFQNMLKSALRKRQGEGGLKFRFFNIDFVICVYLDETKADCDCSKNLSAKEAVTLALALSADSLASGFGAGLGSANIVRIAAASLAAGLGSIALGSFLGQKASCRKPELSWLSGAILILLGLFKYLGV